MSHNTSPKYIITLDKLYYKAHLPKEEHENGTWQFTGPLAQLHNEIPVSQIKIGKHILLDSNFNKAESRKHEFAYKYTIYYAGQKVGLLHYGPDYNSFNKDSGLVGVQINNYTLYQNYCFDALRELHAHAGLKFKHFTELDLAVDTNDNLIAKFDEYYQSPDIYLSKKLNVMLQKQSYPLTRCSHFTIYNKSEELKTENTVKPYINSYFMQNGFGWNETIYRCEVRLNREILTDEYEPNLMRMDDPEYLFGVFTHFQSRFMQFKKVQGKNISRYPDHLLIPSVGSYQFKKVKKNKAGSASDKLSRHSLKQALKQFYWLIENANDDELRSTMWKLIREVQLEEWLAKKKPYFERFDRPQEKSKKGLFVNIGEEVEQ